VLERYQIIDTPNANRMEAVLSEVYGSRFFDVRGDLKKFRAKASHVQLGAVGISYCYYGAKTAVQFPEVDNVRIQIGTCGSSETRIGQHIYAVSGDHSCIIPAGASITAEFGASYSQLVVRVERQALSQKLGALLGSPPSRAIEFDSTVDFKEESLAALRRLMTFATDEVDRGLTRSPVMTTEIEQAIITAFLCSTNHNFRKALDQPSSDIAPWQVRRAEEHIEAHWDRAMSIDSLCREIGTSARSIFAAFKRTRGYTPMEFLKHVRLRRAREMLSVPDGLTSVTQVSIACGFSNLGHFAKDYRTAFAELPSETLAKARSYRRTQSDASDQRR